jgi:alkyl sulfatase BDS1-like metallo-beta-lactamase superfamily hydrolase
MQETAAGALALVTEHLGERPVVAEVYSRSHGDHWGGVGGVIDEHEVRRRADRAERAERAERVRPRRLQGTILTRGRAVVDEGEYRLATENLDKLVHAEPENADAKWLLADAFEQIGYQQESPRVRSSFLAAALELRSGISSRATPKSTGPDVLRAVTTSQFLDLLGVRLDPEGAQELSFTLNLITRDNGEQFVIELSNGTLTNLPGFVAEEPDLTMTIDRFDLERAMMGTVPM